MGAPQWKGACDAYIYKAIEATDDRDLSEREAGVRAALMWVMDCIDNPHPLDNKTDKFKVAAG